MSYWMVLGFAFLNFLGNFLGALLGDHLKSSDKINALALHWAAGMVMSVVSVQIMPKVISGKPVWPIAVSLLAGGMVAIGTHKALEAFQNSKKGDDQQNYRVFSAVIADLFGDGLAIGASSSVSADFAILVVVGLIIGDFPEGFVNMSIFKEQGFSKKKRYLMALSLVLPVIIGGLGAYWVAKDASQTVKYSFLAFTVGLYLRAAVEDMIKKGHSKGGQSGWQQAFFIFGFAAYLIPVMILSNS